MSCTYFVRFIRQPFIFLYYYKWYRLANFKFQLFIAGTQENNWLLYINFASCNLALYAYLFLEFFWSILSNILHRQSCHLWTKSFISSFQSIYVLFPFLLLLHQLRSSNTVLNKNGEKGHVCLIPNLGEKAHRFSSLSTMLAVGFW